ncbi:MAG: MFS transporter [Polyangiaceae bacterium]|nr:MFS transporter [Polyangiaceae bacterium]
MRADTGRLRGPGLFDVRRGERRDVAIAALILFSFMVGHGILETARDALFLARLPARRLPWVYMAMAVTGVVASRLSARLKIRHALRLPVALGAIAFATGALTIPAASSYDAVPYVIYVWSGIAATAATIELWQFLGDRFTVEQAKRVFALVGAGSVLGVAAGSALASVLSPVTSSAGLLLTSSAFMAVAAVMPALLTRRAGGPVSAREREAGRRRSILEVMRTEPYAKRLLGIALLTTLTLTFLDFVFKTSVAHVVPVDRLGVFFGRFYAGLNLVALVVQLFATAWLLRIFGATRALLILPAALLAGAILSGTAPLFIMVLAMKTADGTLRHTVQRTGLEVLYLPLSDSARRAAKGVIEFAGHRGAQALASSVILVAVALGASDRALIFGLAALSVLWISVLLGATAEYVRLFRDYVRSGAVEVSVPSDLDLPALEVLLVALHSSEEREVLAALRLLEQHHKAHLVPPLLVYHPSREVAVEAIEVMVRGGRRDVVPLLGRLITMGDVERRAAALRAHHVLAPDPQLLEAHAGDTTPKVRAAVLVALAAREGLTSELSERVEEVVRGSDSPMKAALAHAIAENAHERWIPVLQELSRSSDELVLMQVGEAARALRAPALVSPLIAMLERRQLRDSARAALAAIGVVALPFLVDALRDPATPLAVRRHLPRTLSRFPSTAASGVLVERLSAEPDGMTRYKILCALGSMRATDPDTALDVGKLWLVAKATRERIIELLGLRVALSHALEPPSPRRELLVGLLEEKEHRALERLFKLLDLLDPAQSYEQVRRGLRHPDEKTRAASREVLTNTLPQEFRADVMSLVDDVADDEKLVAVRNSRAIPSALAAVELMIHDRSQAVRMIAEYCRQEIADTTARREAHVVH